MYVVVVVVVVDAVVVDAVVVHVEPMDVSKFQNNNKHRYVS